jgi:hypothetical protein
MHALIKYKREINRTHKGLGNLYSFSLLGTKAKKCVITIGTAGSGKSVAMKAATAANVNGMIVRDSMTRSGLEKLQKDLNSFRGTFLVEDLGNIDTGYSLLESIKTAVALAYDHKLSKLNAKLDLEISDFYGAFISSIQPEIMPMLINNTSWEAVIRDKTIRYYHILRATKPNRKPINVKVKWGLDITQIQGMKRKSKQYLELKRVFLDQHGLTRAEEHIEDFLKASAALDGRKQVTESDVKVCLELTRPMRLEKILVYKQGVASEKEFLVDHCYMLTEFATYGICTYEQLASNWFVTVKSVKRILHNVAEMWTVRPKDDSNVYMKAVAKDALKESGYL